MIYNWAVCRMYPLFAAERWGPYTLGNIEGAVRDSGYVTSTAMQQQVVRQHRPILQNERTEWPSLMGTSLVFGHSHSKPQRLAFFPKHHLAHSHPLTRSCSYWSHPPGLHTAAPPAPRDSASRGSWRADASAGCCHKPRHHEAPARSDAAGVGDPWGM